MSNVTTRRVDAYMRLLALALTVAPEDPLHIDWSMVVGDIGELLGFTPEERTAMLEQVAAHVTEATR